MSEIVLSQENRGIRQFFASRPGLEIVRWTLNWQISKPGRDGEDSAKLSSVWKILEFITTN